MPNLDIFSPSPRSSYDEVMTHRIFTFATLFSILSFQSAFARIELDSSQLMMKNSEQIGDMVTAKIQKATEIQAAQEDDEEADGLIVEPDAVKALKDALRITLSRPDRDGARSPLYVRLRRELLDLNSHESTVEALADEAISGLKNPGVSPKIHSTYIVLLESLMAEIKPDTGSNAAYKRIIEKIRDADLQVSSKVTTQEMLRSMNKPVSPSLTAGLIVPKEKAK